MSKFKVNIIMFYIIKLTMRKSAFDIASKVISSEGISIENLWRNIKIKRLDLHPDIKK